MGFPIIFSSFGTRISRPKCVKKIIYFRRISKIDLDNLKNDILNSDLKTKPEKELPKLCKQYDTILQTILNKHAPLLTKTVSERPPWMTQEILKAKVRRRRLERVWPRTRYRHDRSRYRVQCNLCNRIMEKAKAHFYANIILENSEDPKKLWKSMNNILHRFPAPSLPDNLSLETICEKFSNFFVDKITIIRSKSPDSNELRNVHPSYDINFLMNTLTLSTVAETKLGARLLCALKC